MIEWRLDGGGPVSRRVAETPDGDRWIDQFNDELLVAAYPQEANGPPISHVIDPFGAAPTQAHPGVYGFGPTDDEGVVVVLFNDGVSTPTVGLYDADRRQPVGPTVDPGIPGLAPGAALLGEGAGRHEASPFLGPSFADAAVKA